MCGVRYREVQMLVSAFLSTHPDVTHAKVREFSIAGSDQELIFGDDSIFGNNPAPALAHYIHTNPDTASDRRPGDAKSRDNTRVFGVPTAPSISRANTNSHNNVIRHRKVR